MQHAWGSILQRVCRYGRDEAGNVGLMVTLALPLLLLSIGGGADYARILAARSKLQAAADSATLATYMHFAGKSGHAKKDDLQAYFDRELRNSLRSVFEQDIRVRAETLLLEREKGKLTARVKADFPTTFMRLAGIPTITMNVEAQAQASVNYTEVALVLDTTASMKGAKLQELKRAAKSFLETIHKRLQGDKEVFKVAIVPFAEYVNVGKRFRNARWIKVPQDRVITEKATWCEEWICDEWGKGEKGKVCVRGHHEPISPCRSETITLKIRWQGCVGSRPSPLNIQDGQYGTRVPGVMNYKRNPQHPENTLDGWLDWDRNHCGTSLLPLTTLKDNKERLIRKINSLKAKGYTYIPSGLVWGWRVLSHEAPFTQGADDDTVKRKNVSKIIILMTDGANTRAPSTESWRSWSDHGSEDAERANRITRRLCDNIKATNPATGKRHAEIITVTFNVQDESIRNLMRQCASLGSFDANSGQLVKVFDNIARRLVELHLSK